VNGFSTNRHSSPKFGTLELDGWVACLARELRVSAISWLRSPVCLRLPALEADPWTDDKVLGILGYAIAPEQQGKGLASEAAASVVELAFTELRLRRLRATVLRDNAASRRVLESIQFRIGRPGVREIPRCGGPPRLGDTFILDRADWIATHNAAVDRAHAETPPT